MTPEETPDAPTCGDCNYFTYEEASGYGICQLLDCVVHCSHPNCPQHKLIPKI